MRTDRQVYKILEVCPEWFFDLTQIDSTGPCSFHSVALKEVSVTADGVIEPVAPEKPFYLVEFQAQSDDSVYVRLVLEMALVQRQHPGRGVEGVIIFLDEDLDPRTEPWHRVIRVFSLISQLSELHERFPNHPLVSVFRPLTESRDKILEAEAADCYNQIASSSLNQLTKEILADVFVSWLEQRFRTKGKKEIEEMLVGALPDLTETQSGRDLIQIGVEKGKAQGKAEGKVEGVVEGKRESLLLILGIRFGAISAKASQTISAIESASRLDELTRQALLVDEIDELQV